MSLILVTPFSPKLVMVLSHPAILIDPRQTSSDVVREFPHVCMHSSSNSSKTDWGDNSKTENVE